MHFPTPPPPHSLPPRPHHPPPLLHPRTIFTHSPNAKKTSFAISLNKITVCSSPSCKGKWQSWKSKAFFTPGEYPIEAQSYRLRKDLGENDVLRFEGKTGVVFVPRGEERRRGCHDLGDKGKGWERVVWKV